MKKNHYYIRGFTFIEMIITIIIASIGTGTMMFVFNAAQTRYFNDQMEASIDTYCNDAADFIATIVSRSDSTIKKIGDNPPRYRIFKFNDKYTNQASDERQDHQREVTIMMDDKYGVLIQENNQNITAELYNKYMLRNHKKNDNGHYEADNKEWNALSPQGSFNPGDKFKDGDENLRTKYILYDFKIEKMDPGDVNINFFHNIPASNRHIRAPLEECTYDIKIVIEIQNQIDENSSSEVFYTYRTYTKRAYCPSCFVRERSSKKNKAENI